MATIFDTMQRSFTLQLSQASTGKTISIPVTQAGYSADFVFTINTNTITPTQAGGTSTFTIVSTKKASDGSTVQVGWTATSKPAWVTANASNPAAFTIAANTTSDDRNGTITLTQAESGKTLTITIGTQAGIPVYTFTITPTSKTFPVTGGSQIVTVTSTKLYNGATTTIPYTVTKASGGGAGITNNNNTITAVANSLYSDQTATFTFKQNESNKTDTFTATLPAKADDGVFTANPTSLTFDPVGATKTSTITSTSKGSTVGWTVSNKASLPAWLTISGEGSGTLSITTTNNV